jgi:DNA-binding NarL/FixJ family response regulator
MLDKPAADPSTTSQSSSLSTRELEVLRLLASGKTNREIAEELVISAKTVMHHSGNIYGKLRVRGRADAIAFAVGSRLIEPPRLE